MENQSGNKNVLAFAFILAIHLRQTKHTVSYYGEPLPDSEG